MDKDRYVPPEVPCESIGADLTVRLAAAGVLWGLTSGPYNATKLGLTGLTKAGYVAKSTGSMGVQCEYKYTLMLGCLVLVPIPGLFAGLYSFTNCGLQSYREKKDWLNASIAGAVTGAVFAARTGSVLAVLSMAALVSSITTASEISTTIWGPSE